MPGGGAAARSAVNEEVVGTVGSQHCGHLVMGWGGGQSSQTRNRQTDEALGIM